MMDFFDKLQTTLADMLDHTNNNVGHFGQQLFAQGGLADSGENQDLSFIQRTANLAKQATTGADASVTGGTRYADNPLGQGYYNSPTYIASHLSQVGRFFSGAEPGNKYTDHFQNPQKKDPLQGQNPETFYASWYNRMRNFAQAEEVATRGQTQVRGT